MRTLLTKSKLKRVKYLDLIVKIRFLKEKKKRNQGFSQVR